MDIHAHHIFPNKVFLSGSDYFHLLLKKDTENNPVDQNIIRIVVDFDREEAMQTFVKNIQSSQIIHWMCNITLQQGSFFSSPYWLYKNAENKIQIHEHHLEGNQRIPDKVLQQSIKLNIDPCIMVDVIYLPNNQTSLIISWHHLLMDGRGAGLSIRHLQTIHHGTQFSVEDFFPKPETSNSIWSQIKNLFFIRYFMEDSVRGPLMTLPVNAPKQKNTFVLKSIHLNHEETNLLDKTAKENGCKFGATLYLLAICAQLFYSLPSLQNKLGTIWVPLPYDGRKRGSKGPMITNCISFLFYRIESKSIESLEEIVKDLQRQMSAQIAEGIPKKYQDFLHSMKRIPVKLTRKLMAKYTHKASPSFLFTAAGQENWDTNHLFKDGVTHIQIIPPFVFPQGLTFSFLRFNNKLTMNLVFEESRLSPDEINHIEHKIKSLFSIHSNLE